MQKKFLFSKIPLESLPLLRRMTEAKAHTLDKAQAFVEFLDEEELSPYEAATFSLSDIPKGKPNETNALNIAKRIIRKHIKAKKLPYDIKGVMDKGHKTLIVVPLGPGDLENRKPKARRAAA